MGEATSLAKRRLVYSLWESDRSYADISQELSLSYTTVRDLCKRFDEHGEKGLITDYANCGQGRRPQRTDLIYRASCWLKRKHRKWGAEYIELILKCHYPDLKVPTARTMQNWYKALGLNPHRDKQPREAPVWAKEVHEVWQVDAKEQLTTADGKPASWLSLVDEHSGAILEAPVFPPQADQSGFSLRHSTGSD